MTHGTISGYSSGCRCADCRAANTAYHRRYRGGIAQVDAVALSDLLHELFPMGLTDDCPARRGTVR